MNTSMGERCRVNDFAKKFTARAAQGDETFEKNDATLRVEHFHGKCQSLIRVVGINSKCIAIR